MLSRFAMVGALCGLLAGAACADGAVGDFNFNETTGLINIPVARVVPAGGVQLSVNSMILPGAPTPVGIDFDEPFNNDGSIKVVGGLPGRVEISAMALHGGFFKNNRHVFGVKWLAVEDAPNHPGFAVGVQSLNSAPQDSNPHPERFNDPSFFGVVSHSFPINDSGMALDLHAGMGTGRLNRGFAGGEFHVTPNFSIMGETDGTIESAGFRFTVSPRFQFMTTAQFQEKVRFGFQLSYNFGPTVDPDPVAEEYEGPTDPIEEPAQPGSQQAPEGVQPLPMEKGPRPVSRAPLQSTATTGTPQTVPLESGPMGVTEAPQTVPLESEPSLARAPQSVPLESEPSLARAPQSVPLDSEPSLARAPLAGEAPPVARAPVETELWVEPSQPSPSQAAPVAARAASTSEPAPEVVGARPTSGQLPMKRRQRILKMQMMAPIHK